MLGDAGAKTKALRSRFPQGGRRQRQAEVESLTSHLEKLPKISGRCWSPSPRAARWKSRKAEDEAKTLKDDFVSAEHHLLALAKNDREMQGAFRSPRRRSLRSSSRRSEIRRVIRRCLAPHQEQPGAHRRARASARRRSSRVSRSASSSRRRAGVAQGTSPWRSTSRAWSREPSTAASSRSA